MDASRNVNPSLLGLRFANSIRHLLLNTLYIIYMFILTKMIEYLHKNMI